MGNQSKLSPSKKKEKQVEKAKGKEKVVAKQKKKIDGALRLSGPLVISEGGSKKKKAQEVSESESDDETQEDSSEEDQPSGALTERGKEKVSYLTYHTALSNCKMFQTRWPDVELLAKLGILEDVRRLLRGMGLEKVLEMEYTCYPKQVLELIASFTIKFNKRPRVPTTLGAVWFQANERIHRISIGELCEAYGFPQKMGRKIVSNKYQDSMVWEIIGKGNYTPGKTKSKLISNPAVRYAHKIIASTIFAKKEANKITEDEMGLLTNGLRFMFRDEFIRRGINGYEDVNLGVILAKGILSTKRWALREDRKTSSLHIGGFLTPLLKLINTRLTHPMKTPKLKLDFACLKRMSFVEGNDGDKVLYTFVGKTPATYKVLLPNVEITTLTSLRNLSFEHDEDLDLVDAGPVETLLSLHEAEGSETGESSTRMEIPLGSPRYYHSPYKGRTRSLPIEHIFGELKKSHRWSKWNSRSIHNIKKSCKKKFKALEDQFKSMFETFVFKKASPPRREDGEFDYALAMEQARRHSIGHAPSSSSQQQPRRKRRLRHIPSPSPPSSDNQSIHLTTTDQDST